MSSAETEHESPTDVLTGLCIGPYIVRERIGEGGMGVVYRADQPALGRSVAIKVLHRHLLGEDDCVTRFEREARAASRLNHPNSVGILEFGTLPDVGRPYLVLEYLRGEDLRTVLAAEPLLPLERVERIVFDVLSALAEAHELGIVHRDLKPENVMLVRYRDGHERSKVLDFGLAKLREPTNDGATLPGVMLGTPAYIAPEVIAGENVDGRTDVYSLGVMLFELLTGEVPWDDTVVARLMLRKLTESAPDPAGRGAPERVTPRLAAATTRALSTDPAGRFATAEEMRAELAAAFRENTDSAKPTPFPLVRRAPAKTAHPFAIEEQVHALRHGARKLIHAAAVLGCTSSLDAVGAIAGGIDRDALARLVATGLVSSLSDDRVELDPMVQRIVYATIPCEDRRQMHDRALAWHGARGDPDSVSLEHAVRGSEALVALFIFERMIDDADRADRREDAIALSRRALLFSRTELDRTGEEILERAHLTFARKLAVALVRDDRRKEAQGILREALALSAPASEQRPELAEALRQAMG